MKNYLWGILGVLSGILLAGILLFVIRPEQGNPISIVTTTPTTLMVHIDGAVRSPGVYPFTSGERVQDGINKAGGFAENADSRNINLAAKLSDGQKIHVPIAGETSIPVALPSADITLININTATLDELCELPGIGESKAGDIIAYRQTYGDFQNIMDLQNVPGIGASIFDKIDLLITVN
jgi:competence protein ComEA